MLKLTALLSTLDMLLHLFIPLHLPPQHVICVDAGHGGDDPGAINSTLTEAEVNLDLAQRLQILLEQNNYKVIMTRTNNSINPTNSERAEVCNAGHADLLISIHLSSSTDTQLDYTQALYGTALKDKKFASTLHQKLVSELDIADHGDDGVTDFHDNLLLKAKMPATLQEVVFISNSSEYDQLTDGTEQRQQQIVQAIYDGINTWYHQKQDKE